MKKLLAIFVLICAVTNALATNVTKVASDLTAANPSLTYTVDSDTPEGSLLIPFTSSAMVTITVPLGFTATAGHVIKVFPKQLDYDQGSSYAVTAGGVTSSWEQFNDRDSSAPGTGYWPVGVAVTPATDATSITITETRASVHDERLFAVYVTTDTNDVLLSDDRVLNFTYPSSFDSSSPVAGNHFPNSSFETGIGPMWRAIVANGNSRTKPLEDLWSTAQAFHGTHCAALPAPASGGGTFSLQSVPFVLTSSNKVHTASVYVRAASASATANLYVKNLYTAPSGFTSTLQVVASGTAVVGSWTRLSVTFTNIFYPNGQYFIELLTQGQSTATDVYFDALQIEEGSSATAYAPLNAFEFDAAASDQTRCFWNTDSPTLTLRAFNNSGGNLTKTVNYKVFNQWNAISFYGSVSVTANAGTSGTATLNVPVSELGHFRGQFWIDGQAGSDTELTWLVIPQPPTLSADTNSYFGFHSDTGTNSLARIQRLGGKWRRALSVGRCRWSEVETSAGVYAWPDFSNDATYGISEMINLGEDIPFFLGSVTTNYATITNRYALFCAAAATHYTGCHFWEIWNEENQDRGEITSDSAYAQFLIVAADSIHGVRASDAVVGAGGVSTASDLDSIFSALGSNTNKMQALSVHLYPPNEANSPAINTGYTSKGWAVYNSESGPTDKGSFTGARKAFRTAGSYAISWKSGKNFYDSFYADYVQQSRNILTCVANGLTKQFFYDMGMRNLTVDDFDSRQWTVFESDDSFKAKAAMLPAIYKLIDKSTGKGVVTVTGCSAYGVDRGGVPVVGIWAAALKTVTLAGVSAGNLKVYDVVGNSVTPSSLALNVGPLPIFVEGQGGMSYATLSGAFTGGTVGSRSDVTAPNVRLLRVPRTANDELVFRWGAVDDSGCPDETTPSAIQYSYRVDGGAWSAWAGQTWVNLSSFPTTFEVRAQDAAGNIGYDAFGGATTSLGYRSWKRRK